MRAARAAFNERGYTAHTPTLRHHELPIRDGAAKIARLSLSDHVNDLVTFVDSLEPKPLLVGHSVGGLLAQLVAARTRHRGLIAARPAPAPGIAGSTSPNMRMSMPWFFRLRPWARPLPPPTFERFKQWVANTQSEDTAWQIYDGLVCEFGRAQCEMLLAVFKLSKATYVRTTAINTPVLVMGANAT